jgi:predicted nucleic acid-binding Zn ribbon protein
MALEKCIDCGAEISSEAPTCPKCGAPQRRTSFLTKIVGGFFALVVVMMVAANWQTSNERERAADAEAARVAKLTPEQKADEQRQREAAAAAKKLEDLKDTAAYACREFVTRRLKDPDSAKWERPWHTDARVSKDGKYSVQVQVRAKNGFGAFGLSAFDCTMQRVGDNFALVGGVREIR